MDFLKLRREYETAGINELEMPECPFDCFKTWFALAVEKCPGQWYEPHAIALATSDLSGKVTVRMVLLKGVTERGFQFFTNYESAKGKQLAVNPRASLVMHWPYLGRQIRIEGVTEKTSREISEEYFHSRPRGSQIGAAASAQSQPIESRAELERIAKQVSDEFQNQAIPLPETWGGYLLTPERIEFWQGRLDRLHDRIVYQKSATDWERTRICP